MRLLRYGEAAVLAECGDSDPLAVYDALLSDTPPGVLRAVPAARTVLIEIDPRRTSLEQLDAFLTALPPTGEPPRGGTPIDIAVRYDGPDLAGVARELGIDVDEVVRRHSDSRYRVAFCGFAPGFAYLTGLDPVLHVPRLTEPRTAVPAGSVAIAGEFAAVYPRRSPGGWRLLGSTDVELWQVNRDPPALLVPGTPVRFVPS